MTQQSSSASDSDLNAFLRSWSLELKARQDRVRSLIGDAHWLSDGHHKEAIVKEFLTRYLPANYSVSRGFVKPADLARRVSPEIDVLVCDAAKHPPLFNEGGLVIAPPSSAVAHLELKTKFGSATLAMALETISNTQRSISTSASPSAIWRCICFFDSDGVNNDTALTRIKSGLAKSLSRETAATSVSVKGYSLPTCIVVVEKFVAFVRCEEATSLCTLRLFPAGEASLAFAFADMFALLAKQSGNGIVELDQMIEQSAFGNPLVERFESKGSHGKEKRTRVK